MSVLRWGEVSWTEIDALDRSKCAAVLPLGAVEAHGPHLPLLTDGVIAEAMAESAARRSSSDLQILILPTLDYAAAPFAEDFPGTISVAAETVTSLIADIGRSVDAQGFRCFAIANAHLDPAHLASIDSAVAALRDTTNLEVVFPNLTRKPWAFRLTEEFKSGACHAGQFEGSIILAARPEWVREDERRSLPPNPNSISEAIRSGKRSFSEAGGPNAYFGAPAAATAEEGRQTIEVLGSILVEAIEESLAPDSD